MKKLLSFFLLCAWLGANAQKSTEFNDPNAKQRTLQSEFTAISISSGIQLFLTQSDQVRLAVSASEQKFEERFKTEVVNGELKIYYDTKADRSANYKNRKLIAYLSVKDVQAIRVSSGAIVRLVNPLKVNQLSLDCNSGSLMSGTLGVSVLKIEATSGAQLTLGGTADKVEVLATSGALFKGGDLRSLRCNVEASSGAVVNIAVQETLVASASSGAAVKYTGDAILNKRSVRSGAIIKKVR